MTGSDAPRSNKGAGLRGLFDPIQEVVADPVSQHSVTKPPSIWRLSGDHLHDGTKPARGGDQFIAVEAELRIGATVSPQARPVRARLPRRADRTRTRPTQMVPRLPQPGRPRPSSASQGSAKLEHASVPSPLDVSFGRSAIPGHTAPICDTEFGLRNLARWGAGKARAVAHVPSRKSEPAPNGLEPDVAIPATASQISTTALGFGSLTCSRGEPPTFHFMYWSRRSGPRLTSVAGLRGLGDSVVGSVRPGRTRSWTMTRRCTPRRVPRWPTPHAGQAGKVQERNEVVGCRDRLWEVSVILQGDDVSGRRRHRHLGRVIEATGPVEPPSGWFQSMRRRLWTTLPLPTMKMPRSRSGASLAPSSRW